MSKTLLKELTDGWIERRGDYFVSSYLESKFKWEDKIDVEEEPFVTSIVRDLKLDKYYDVKQVVRTKAYYIARIFLQAIGVVPHKHRITVSNGNDSYTDGTNIVVSDKPLREAYEDETAYKNYDVFVGLALHEGCHIIYTSFAEMAEKVAEKDLKGSYAKLYHTLVNIVEDERIERRMIDKYPGNGNYIGRLKEYYFGDVFSKETKLSEEENIEEFLNVFLQLIRYPRYIDDLLLERYFELLCEVKELLIPYPEEMDEMLDKTYEVFELLIDYFGLKFDDDMDEESRSEIEKEIEDAIEKVKEVVPTVSDTIPKPKKTPDAKSDEEKIVDGEAGMTGHGMYYRAEKGTKADYLEKLSHLKHLIPGFRHFLVYNNYKKLGHYMGLKSGQLDTGKLVEGYQGAENIYYRKEKPVLKKLSIALLVDQSGSMGGRRIECARDCTILLAEVLSKNKDVELFIYGYTGQYRHATKAELIEYYTPKNRDLYSIATMTQHTQNLDGYSLLQVREKVREHTKDECLLFMISDGEPAAHGYHGKTAIKHLSNSVKTLKNDGFKILHIAVGYEGLPGVYGNVVQVSDPRDLSSALIKVIKKVLSAK